MEQKNSDIALVVVDAVSSDIDESEEIVLPRIQRLISEGVPRLKDAGLTTKIYEFFSGESKLSHDGIRINRTGKANYRIGGVPYNLILVGGTLGNDCYNAFVSLLKQSRKIGRTLKMHLPFDCISAFEYKTDSGDTWASGRLASPDTPIFDDYIKAIRGYAPSAYLIERDGKVTERSPITTLKLWSEWKSMVDCLTAKKSG